MTKTSKAPSLLWICVCAWLTGNVVGILFSWSYFRESIAQLFPSWSATQLSLVFNLHNVTVVVTMLIAGQLLKKVKPRTVVFIGSTMTLIGFGLFPLLPVSNPSLAYIMLIICFSCIAATASGFCGLTVTSVYPMWAPNHMGLVAGVAIASCGISPFYLGVLLGWLIPLVGVLRAVQFLGIGVWILVMITLPWCKYPDADIVLPAPKKQENVVSQRDYNTKEILLSPVFWIVFLFCGLNRGAGFILQDYGGTIAGTFGAATIVGMIFAPANGGASLLGGVASDRIGLSKTTLISASLMVLCGILLLLGNAANSIVLVASGLICGGLSYGSQMTLAATIVRALFGNKYYSQNYSFIGISIAPGALCGVAAGALYDLAGRTFGTVFTFILLLGIVGLVLVLLIMKKLNKKAKA